MRINVYSSKPPGCVVIMGVVGTCTFIHRELDISRRYASVCVGPLACGLAMSDGFVLPAQLFLTPLRMGDEVLSRCLAADVTV